jgi:NAD(P)-dependent dehydrogenase (short-subunit alcohol dehydrogenase family)
MSVRETRVSIASMPRSTAEPSMHCWPTLDMAWAKAFSIRSTFQAADNESKAFLDSFSFALRAELKDTGITTTPGSASPRKEPRRGPQPFPTDREWNLSVRMDAAHWQRPCFMLTCDVRA